MIFVWNMLIVFTCIYSIAFKSVWHSFEKVVFRTHSSPCERVWHCLSSCTTSSGNLFRYMCIAIPWKEGDVSVRKCSMTPWNGHFFTRITKKNPCRKSSQGQALFWKAILNHKQHFTKPLFSNSAACYASCRKKNWWSLRIRPNSQQQEITGTEKEKNWKKKGIGTLV